MNRRTSALLQSGVDRRGLRRSPARLCRASTAVLTAIQAATGEAGCLLIVKNYTGDRLNFSVCMEKAQAPTRQ